MTDVIAPAPAARRRLELDVLDVRKARELVDGVVQVGAPYRHDEQPSWFRSDADRRTYWRSHAAAIVTWTRQRSLGYPDAARRYGLPYDARVALWASAA